MYSEHVFGAAAAADVETATYDMPIYSRDAALARDKKGASRPEVDKLEYAEAKFTGAAKRIDASGVDSRIEAINIHLEWTVAKYLDVRCRVMAPLEIGGDQAAGSRPTSRSRSL